VNLAVNNGAPKHLASGFIYGIPDTLNQIPSEFYTDMGFIYGRAGGAQTATTGWIGGLASYRGRFASALSNYQTTRQHGGTFILLIHDIWGADGTQPSTAPYPGDNGDWTSWDDYLTQLISDINANNMTPGLQIDIWNEPDLTGFWNRPQSQWIQLWGRTYHRLRSDLPSVSLLGPTLAGSPQTTNTWWTSFLSFIGGNSSIPDQYVWHLEGSTSDVNDDLQTNIPVLMSLLESNRLPTNIQINIDEYGVFNEQVPSGAAWWISRLERFNAFGLRGNWLSTTQLHDFLASLLGKTNVNDATGTGYFPNAEWQVYKYYALNMTGHRVATTGSTDRLIDTYATVTTDNKVKVLVGVRQQIGTWQVTIEGLSTVGLPQSGTLNIQTWGFPDEGHFGELTTPDNLGIVAHTYSGNAVTFPIFQTDTGHAFAFEIVT